MLEGDVQAQRADAAKAAPSHPSDHSHAPELTAAQRQRHSASVRLRYGIIVFIRFTPVAP